MVSESFDIFGGQHLVGNNGPRQTTSDDLIEAIWGETRAWLFYRNMFTGDDRAGRQIRAGHQTARKQLSQRRGFFRRRVLVDRMRVHAFDEPDSVHELTEFLWGHRRDAVGPKPPPWHPDVYFRHVVPHRRAREARINRGGMIRQADPAAVTLAVERDQVEADLLGWARIRRCALKDADVDVVRADARDGSINFFDGAHPRSPQNRFAGVKDPFEQHRVRCFA